MSAIQRFLCAYFTFQFRFAISGPAMHGHVKTWQTWNGRMSQNLLVIEWPAEKANCFRRINHKFQSYGWAGVCHQLSRVTFWHHKWWGWKLETDGCRINIVWKLCFYTCFCILQDRCAHNSRWLQECCWRIKMSSLFISWLLITTIIWRGKVLKKHCHE